MISQIKIPCVHENTIVSRNFQEVVDVIDERTVAFSVSHSPLRPRYLQLLPCFLMTHSSAPGNGMGKQNKFPSYKNT